MPKKEMHTLNKGLALKRHYGFSLLGPRHKNQLLAFALRKNRKKARWL
jgi:hypothetical protein